MESIEPGRKLHTASQLRSSVEVTGAKRQVALVLGVALGLGSGFAGLYFSTLPIFLKPIAESFGWSRADTSGVIVMSMLGSAVGAPLVGALMDRIGAVRLIGLSMLMFVGSLFSLSLLPGNHALFAAMSLATGLLGVGTAPAGYLAVLSQAFNRRLGLALSLSMVGIGLGAMGFPIVAQWLLGLYGWRNAYRGLAAIALAVGLISYLLVLQGQSSGKVTRAQRQADEGMTFAAAARDRRFWTLLAVMFAATAAGLGAIVHLPAMLTDRGMPAADAATLAAFPGLGLMLGRLVSGALMDLIFAPRLASIAFILGVAGLGTLSTEGTSSGVLLALSAVLFGFALGMEGDFAAYAVRRYFGTRSFGLLYGLMYAAYALGGVAGPVVYGMGFDRSGGYGTVLILALSSLFFAAVAVLTLGPYRWARR